MHGYWLCIFSQKIATETNRICLMRNAAADIEASCPCNSVHFCGHILLSHCAVAIKAPMGMGRLGSRLVSSINYLFTKPSRLAMEKIDKSSGYLSMRDRI